jgi:hypothetical protein
MHRPILFILIIIDFGNALAQESSDMYSLSPKKLISEIEVFGGPNLSNYWGKDVGDDQVTNLNYIIGLGLCHSIKNNLDVNIRIMLEKKGNKLDYYTTFYDSDNNAITYRFIQGNNLEYLTASILTKYYMGNMKRFIIGTGIYFGHLQKAKTYAEQYSVQGNQISYYYSDSNHYKDFDIGLSAAIGFRVPLRSNIIFNTQLFTNLGLIDIINRDLPNMDGNPVKNYILAIQLGISLKRK